ncbi:MAG: lipopolysaccharide biosynthesis protein [Actinomycetota bacterium]
MTDGPATERSSADDADQLIPVSTRGVQTALGWSFVMNGARLASTLGTAFLLASVLGPEAFGTVALALLFIAFVQVLIEQGVIPAIVQRPGLTWRHLDSAYWMALLFSLVMVAICCAISPWWASVNDTPDAKVAIWALSTLVVLKGLVVVQEATLHRALRYRDLAIRTTAASVLGAIVGIVWALVAPSIWALVAQQIVTAVVAAVVIWLIVDWRPHWRFRRADARDLLPFAFKSTLSSVGVFVNSRIDALLIGVFFGATAIGLYQLSYRLVAAVIETTVLPIAGVALADLSRSLSDRERLAERYRSLSAAAFVIGAPVLATVFVCAEPLMEVVGDEWSAAAPALQLLTIVGLVSIVGMVNSPALQAAGHPGAQAWIVWFGAVVSAVSFVGVGLLLEDSGTADQVLGMAASRAVVSVVFLLPISQWLVARFVGVSVFAFLRSVGPPIIVCAVAASLGLLVQVPLVEIGLASAVVLVIAAMTTLATAATLLLLTDVNARNLVAQVAERIPGAKRLIRPRA